MTTSLLGSKFVQGVDEAERGESDCTPSGANKRLEGMAVRYVSQIIKGSQQTFNTSDYNRVY